MKKDILIIGGGPAGLTAGIYAARAGLKAAVIEKLYSGGQIATTSSLENYPGFPEAIGGIEFSMNLDAQARNQGVEIINEEVIEFSLTGAVKKVVTSENEYQAFAVILAMGANPRLLSAPGEDEFRSRGVSYCATCDGHFYKDRTVAVIGGGNTAAEEAEYLSNICEQVYLIHRRDELRADDVLAQRVMMKKNINILWDTVVDTIEGSDKVEQLQLRNKYKDEKSAIDVDGVFVAIGVIPNTNGLGNNIRLDDGGYIIVDKYKSTNVLGVFAAGDITDTPLRQVVTGAADGAIAAHSAITYLNEHMAE